MSSANPCWSPLLVKNRRSLAWRLTPSWAHSGPELVGLGLANHHQELYELQSLS